MGDIAGEVRDGYGLEMVRQRDPADLDDLRVETEREAHLDLVGTVVRNNQGPEHIGRTRPARSRATHTGTHTHASGVKPMTTSNLAASSPALDPGIGVNGTMTDWRALASEMPRSTPSFSFCGSPSM